MPSKRKRKLKIGNLIIVIVSLLVVCAGGFSLIHMIANKKDKTVIRKDPGAISTNEPVETEEPKENKVSLFLTGDGLLHDSVYTDAENDKQHICDAIIELRKFIEDDEILKFVKRKAQLYTVFSVIFYLQREDENVTDVHVEKLKNFVKLYSVFDNDMDMDGKLSDEEKNIYDMLKKYKLASSEGLNKHTNRMIRYNVLKDFLCDKKNTDDIQAGLYDKIVNYVEER